MSDLQAFIESANRLCATLDQVAQNETQFCIDMCIELQKYSRSLARTTSAIGELKQHYGY